MRYGVREELLELVRLEGVGRVRARAPVPHLGPGLAQSIKRQAELVVEA